MIVLPSTTSKLQVVLSANVATAQMQCAANWRDVTPYTFTPGRNVTLTNNTTDVDLVVAPAASTQRVIDFFSIYNADVATGSLTVKIDDGVNEYILWRATLLSGEVAQYHDKVGFRKLNTSGVDIETFAKQPVDAQIFTTPGDNTWTKPTLATHGFTPKIVLAVAIGAGGGGGGGSSWNSNTMKAGGTGGGGGCLIFRWYTASDLGATETAHVGTGGTPGAGVAGANGTDGGTGDSSTFLSGVYQLTAFGGGGGLKGTDNAGGASGGGGAGTGSAGGVGVYGARSSGGYPGSNQMIYAAAGTGPQSQINPAVSPYSSAAEYGGGAGGSMNISNTHPGLGGTSIHGGGGGGNGGGVNTVPAFITPWSGGASNIYNLDGGGGGAAGTNGASPTVGTAGAAGNGLRAGCGGGGGGGTNTGGVTGAAGGDGGAPGGGAGGGGNGRNNGATGTGGAGGTGGRGEVRVYCW